MLRVDESGIWIGDVGISDYFKTLIYIPIFHISVVLTCIITNQKLTDVDSTKLMNA